jgi:hypothetical protein
MVLNELELMWNEVVGAYFNPLKPEEEREREKRKWGEGVAIGTTFNGGDINLDLRLRRSPGSARSSFCRSQDK